MKITLEVEVEVEETEDGCWVPVPGQVGVSHLKGGYTRLTFLAHRLSYKTFVGEIPDGLHIDHLACDNPPCFNYEHLDPSTQVANTLRGNGWGGVNSRKTHCPRGHEYNDQNTKIKMTKKGPARVCKLCAADYMRRKRAEMPKRGYASGDRHWSRQDPQRARDRQRATLARLNPTQVRKIRKLVAAGESQRAVAEKFGVSPATVNCIIKRRTWVDVA